MAAPRPTPTRLKLVRGNPGKRPLPKNEPKPKAAPIKAPAGMSRGAIKYYASVATMLSDVGVLTVLDVPMLVLYCEACARWAAANKQIKKHGPVVVTKSGFPVQSPYVAISNKAFDQMKSIMLEFGMSPASRTRVEMAGKGPDDNPFDNLGA